MTDKPNSREVVDTINEQDVVIGRATRRETHDRGLLHRAVHVLAFDQAGNVVLQRRVGDKAFNPGRWTSTVSGHVTAGDTYDAAAEREVVEELQLPGPVDLEYVGKVRADARDQRTGRSCRTWTAVYTMRLTIPVAEIRPQVSELADVETFPLSQVVAATKGEATLVSADGEAVEFADNFAPIIGLQSNVGRSDP